jgi:hypothetical protein
MKKIISILFVMSLIVTIAGCGGGKGSGNTGNPSRSGYYYKWSNGFLASAYVKPSSMIFGSVAYADDPTPTPTPIEPPQYIGSEIPPFSSIDDHNPPQPSGTLLILTYYNGAQVKSSCNYNSSDGSIVDYDLGGNGNPNDMVPSFVPKKQGLFHVTATYNGEAIDIPVRVYHFIPISLNGSDLDGDGKYDIQNQIALYGYQVINNGYLSLVASAPPGDYTTNASLPAFTYEKIFVIKTSSGKYMKIYPTGACGENSYNNMNLLSDSNGNFAY